MIVDQSFLNQLFGESELNAIIKRWSHKFGELDHYTPNIKNISIEHDKAVSLTQLGIFEFTNIDKLPVFVIALNTPINEKTGKKYQFDLAKSILKNHGYINGLFLFHNIQQQAFRMSLVFSEFHDTKRKFNYYKRFSFYVSPQQNNRTFIKQFGACQFKTLNDVKTAFSVEPVTKEFYQLLEKWYNHSLNHVQFPKGAENEPNGKNIQLIRFITRLIFIWFMKVKGIVPENLFDEKEIKKILKDELDDNSSSYYLAILQNLFFATLNTPIEQRKFLPPDPKPGYNPHYMNHNVFRHHQLVKDKNIFKHIFGQIPFLNGGLFDCLDTLATDPDNPDKKIEIRIDGFSNKKSKQPIFPNHLIFNDNPDNPGIINILRTFNFTIDENSPIDNDIALDPELLGKVFENLLASYNPETQANTRKATGSFYTPREVVDYMCHQSLLYYLKNNLKNIDENLLDALFDYSDETPALDNETKKQIVQALLNCKILDPACGSGAFPIGMLQKILFILNKIDPDNSIFKDIKLHAINNLRKNLTDITPEMEQIIQQIKNKLEEKTDDYNRKLHIIENCIYGVDIQPIAIQIAKLRCFITLLVEETVNEQEKNKGIHTLPNLDLKFIVANTLIPLHSDIQLFEPFLDDLKNLMHQYFEAYDPNEKKKLKENDFAKIKNKLISEVQFDPILAKQIEEFNPFDTDHSHSWFDPKLMFGIHDGFDIVIGNPPYISTKGVDRETKKQFEKHYGFADDTYNHFFFKSFELLKHKGILAFITSKTFWTIQTKKNLRHLLLNNTLLTLFDTANPFENAMVDTCVAIAQKNKAHHQHTVLFLDGRKDLQNPEKFTIPQADYANAPNHVFFIPTDFNKKIYKHLGTKVNELLSQWWDKISTSKNIEKHKRELEAYRKSLKPGHITLLGLITEGGVGIQTGNNGKYIGVLEGTKWADNVRKQRPEKLLLATQFCKTKNIKNKADAQAFLDNLSEKEIRQLFDDLKEQYGRDVFGQGWLYRIVSPDEIADVNKLTDNEKLNGITGKKTFVPYDKGDKDGNRWYAPTPYYIDWSRENVKFLKENSGKKGEGMPVVRNPQFYFREGFCWNNVLSDEKIKCRLKEKSVHSTEAMTFISLIPELANDYFLICLLNTEFFGNYRMDFINVSHHLTTGDAKEFPIIIPTLNQLKEFEEIFNRAVQVQRQKFAGKLSEQEAEAKLDEIQKQLDERVLEMYGLK